MVNEEFIKDNKPFLVTQYKSKSNKLTTEDIEDLVQDTFEKVTLYQDYFINDFDVSKKIPEHKRLHAWLKLVCVQVYDRHHRGSLQIDEIANDYSKDDLLESHNDYYYNNNKEEVDKLINMLPNKQRDVVYFKLILGHTHDEVAFKVNTTVTAAQTVFKRGLANLKKLVNSDNPEEEVLYEPKLLKPHGDKPYAGDWAWRFGESEQQRNGECYTYTQDEVKAYCQANNVNYKG